MTNEERLKEIRERLRAVDGCIDGQGEWYASRSAEAELPPMVFNGSGDSIVSILGSNIPYFEPEIAEFVANAKQDIPYLLDEIERLSSPRWVSVKERLPELDIPVLLFSRRSNTYLATRRRNADDEIKWMFCLGGWIADEDATHWQSLPAAPEGEGNVCPPKEGRA